MATTVVIGKVQGEVRKGTSGSTPVVNFRVAERKFVGKGKGYQGKGYDTEWWSVAFFGQRAESVAPFLEAGTLVAVSGDAGLRQYEHNGEKRAELQVKANDVTLLGGRPAGDAAPRAAAKGDAYEYDFDGQF